MAANVEQMFYVGRELPWHGRGINVEEAPDSKIAIVASGLNTLTEKVPIRYADSDIIIPNNFATRRATDHQFFGIVGNNYTIVQNEDAFNFTDQLIGEGCVYETAGSLGNGEIIWLLARLPESIQIAGDKIMPYLCFTNRHDGKGSVKVFISSIRVVCQNTLNAAMKSATRSWSARHTSTVSLRIDEASRELKLANNYMKELKETSELLARKKISDADELRNLINLVVKYDEAETPKQKENLNKIVSDIKFRYRTAPDLVDRENTLLRFVHAVSDTATHMDPLVRSKGWEDRHLKEFIFGSEYIDRAYAIATERAS